MSRFKHSSPSLPLLNAALLLLVLGCIGIGVGVGVQAQTCAENYLLVSSTTCASSCSGGATKCPNSGCTSFGTGACVTGCCAGALTRVNATNLCSGCTNLVPNWCPSSIPNGRLTGNGGNTSVRATGSLSCDSGFSGDGSVTCQENRQWSRSCFIDTCSSISTTRATVTYNSSQSVFDISGIVQCDFGYQISSGVYKLITDCTTCFLCSYSWSPNPPSSCTVFNGYCQAPAVENGQVTIVGTSTGRVNTTTTFNVTCSAGYLVSSNSAASMVFGALCQPLNSSLGAWNVSFPTCQPILCPTLSVANATVLMPSPAVNGSTATITCASGFAPSPANRTSATCVLGAWTGAPSCSLTFASTAASGSATIAASESGSVSATATAPISASASASPAPSASSTGKAATSSTASSTGSLGQPSATVSSTPEAATSSSGFPIAAVAAAVGGLIGIALIVFAVLLIRKRRKLGVDPTTSTPATIGTFHNPLHSSNSDASLGSRNKASEFEMRTVSNAQAVAAHKRPVPTPASDGIIYADPSKSAPPKPSRPLEHEPYATVITGNISNDDMYAPVGQETHYAVASTGAAAETKQIVYTAVDV